MNGGCFKTVAIIFLTAVFGLPCEQASAAVAGQIKRDIPKIVQRSDLIIRGKVISTESQWKEDSRGRHIYTTVTVRILDKIKGKIKDDAFTFEVVGGIVDDIREIVSNTPSFEMDEDVIVFLSGYPLTIQQRINGKILIYDSKVYLDSSEVTADSFIHALKILEQAPGANIPLGEKYQAPTAEAADVPIITDISFDQALAVTITGTNFGSTQGSGKVKFFNKSRQQKRPASIISWSNTQIICTVPANISAGSSPVTVTTSDGTSSSYIILAAACYSYSGYEWPGASPTVSYKINQNTSDCTGEGAAVQSGADTWNNVGANFTFQYGGSHTHTVSSYNSSNEIMWGSSSALAETNFWIDDDDLMLECDIVFNDPGYTWSSTTPSSSQMDVETVALHELGHWLCLNDLYDSADSDEVMYYQVSSGEVQRELRSCDCSGICYIYGGSNCGCDSPVDYCPASTASNNYEYISSVVVGDISNTGTGSDNYVDYTLLSTTMEAETGYPITVTNGAPWSSDECGIWVDWNQDLIFDEVGESITVSESPGEGPYTATITPPTGASLGDTRMRIRIVYNQTPVPCDTSSYGEVEDYTITVTAAQQPLTVSGYVKTDGNTAIEGVLITGTNGAGTDTTEANGFYELTLPTNPWTGTITPSKAIWSFVPASTGYSGLNYDVTDANFTGHYNYGGGSGTSGSPYLIATPQEMNAVGAHPEDWDKHFKLIADIDLSSYTGTEFNIIGTFIPPAFFTGTFDGNDHKISNFSYTTTGQNCIGLFGAVGGPDTEAEIKNLTLVDPNVDVGSGGDAGALVGFWFKVGTLSDCAVIGGSVKGNGGVAGLLGSNFYGNIIRCSSSADVNATSTESSPAGGLIGINNFGQVSQCYTSGTVTSNNVAGGLIGSSAGGSTINCYSKATVTGPDYAGGLVGYNGSAITNCYSVGGVSGAGDYVGGLVGGNSGGAITASFWDVNTSGQPGPWVGTDLTTAQMQTESTFTDAGWDFVDESVNGPNDVWKICDGMNYPKLAWQAVLPGDLVCPDGVDMQDYAVAAEQWQRQVLVSDIAPDGGDGIVNLLDWAPLANGWPGTTDIDDVAVFADQWLQPSAYCADIAPLPDGDGVVDWFDVAVVAENWLEGVGP